MPSPAAIASARSNISRGGGIGGCGVITLVILGVGAAIVGLGLFVILDAMRWAK